MVTELLVASGLLGLVILGVWAVKRFRVDRGWQEQLWRSAAKALGPRFRPLGDGYGAVGESDGLLVRVENARVGTLLQGRLRLEGQGRIPRDLRLRAEGAFADVSKALVGEDLQLDDAAFDAQVNVAGPEDEVLAALGSATRKHVHRWVAAGGKVEGGDLVLERSGAFEDVADVEETFRLATAAARSFKPGSVPAGLSRNAVEDPSFGVRQRNLEALVARHAGTPEARAALRGALRDTDPRLRFFAAQHFVGEEASRDTLVQLVKDQALPDEQRAAALDCLVAGYRYPHKTVAVVLGSDAAERAPALRRAAVRAAGVGKDEAALETLVALAAGCAEAGLGGELAKALCAYGDSHAEGALLSLLAKEDPIRRDAARALAKVGTVRSVEPLLAIAKGALSGESREAARDAVRAIQARLGDAEGGRLSVVDAGESGALSVDPAREGEKGGA